MEVDTFRMRAWEIFEQEAPPYLKVISDALLEDVPKRPHHIGYRWCGYSSYHDVLHRAGMPMYLGMADEADPRAWLTTEGLDIPVRLQVAESAGFGSTVDYYRARGGDRRSREYRAARTAFLLACTDTNGPLTVQDWVSSWTIVRLRDETRADALLRLYAHALSRYAPPYIDSYQSWDLLVALRGDTHPTQQLLLRQFPDLVRAAACRPGTPSDI